MPVGLVLGDTENAVVVTDLLADLVARGLRYEHGIVAVLDGSKALRKAVVKVFGERALVQRCTLHKRRNVIGYLPVGERDAIDRRLAHAFAHPDPAKGLAACQALARQLDGRHPDAAASLREGLEEMFTVARLGVTGRLRRSLTNTNCIESMISIARTTTGRVKHWRDGTMKKRWIAAGMLEAERSFRRIKGCSEMPAFVAAVPGPPHPTLSHPPTTLRSPEQVRDHHRTSTGSGTSSPAPPRVLGFGSSRTSELSSCVSDDTPSAGRLPLPGDVLSRSRSGRWPRTNVELQSLLDRGPSGATPSRWRSSHRAMRALGQ